MRNNWPRVVFYLILNVIVSALTTWLVVTLMVRANLITPAVPVADETGVQAQPASGQSDGGGAAPAVEVVPDQLEISSVIGVGDLENERVLLQHIGDTELSLEGWQLVDQQGNTYTFPGLLMHSGGAVTVYTKIGTNTVVELYWGMDVPVFEAGELVTLLDPEGNPQATYQVP